MSKIPTARPITAREMIEASAHALANGRLFLGESVLKFEGAFARYNGTERTTAASSGVIFHHELRQPSAGLNYDRFNLRVCISLVLPWTV